MFSGRFSREGISFRRVGCCLEVAVSTYVGGRFVGCINCLEVGIFEGFEL